jgi:hypothetical protein
MPSIVFIGTDFCAYAGIWNCRDMELPGYGTAGIWNCRDMELPGYGTAGIWNCRDMELPDNRSLQFFKTAWQVHTSPSDNQDLFSLGEKQNKEIYSVITPIATSLLDIPCSILDIQPQCRLGRRESSIDWVFLLACQNENCWNGRIPPPIFITGLAPASGQWVRLYS